METPLELIAIQKLLDKAFERGHKIVGICITPELNSKLQNLTNEPNAEIITLFGLPAKISNMPAIITESSK